MSRVTASSLGANCCSAFCAGSGCLCLTSALPREMRLKKPRRCSLLLDDTGLISSSNPPITSVERIVNGWTTYEGMYFNLSSFQKLITSSAIVKCIPLINWPNENFISFPSFRQNVLFKESPFDPPSSVTRSSSSNLSSALIIELCLVGRPAISFRRKSKTGGRLAAVVRIRLWTGFNSSFPPALPRLKADCKAFSITNLIASNIPTRAIFFDSMHSSLMSLVEMLLQ
mmetsp:Transcript_23854/g.35249  ORF Transcript_23854/g.35249 Transcript_23854/m.35249 type:complete len:228 (+) Transcript_23854:668-1351(+)